MSETKPETKSYTWIEILAIIFAIAGLGLIVYFAIQFQNGEAKFSLDKPIDHDRFGHYGDFIGGLVGSIFSLASVALLYVAVKYQKAEMKQAVKQLTEQSEYLKKQQFESKFYELLRIHKQNVDEVKIKRLDTDYIERRKAYVSMYTELKYVFYLCRNTYVKLKNENRLQENYSDEKLIKLAYTFFYAGVGDTSDIVSLAIVKDDFNKILYNEVKIELRNTKSFYSLKAGFPHIDSRGVKVTLDVKYKPFVGHMSRLGHYYRHLFQMVKFVVGQREDILKFEDKEMYLRTLRAQLSDYEQVLLYYNALSGFGKEWLDNEYFTKYRMIHNLPLPLASFGVTPEEFFKKDIGKQSSNKKIFEWHES